MREKINIIVMIVGTLTTIVLYSLSLILFWMFLGWRSRRNGKSSGRK